MDSLRIAANEFTLTVCSTFISLLKPYKNCAKIIPEFPLAPTKAAFAMASAVCFKLLVGIDVSIIARMVDARLVPVSASATGNTLILFNKF